MFSPIIFKMFEFFLLLFWFQIFKKNVYQYIENNFFYKIIPFVVLFNLNVEYTKLNNGFNWFGNVCKITPFTNFFVYFN